MINAKTLILATSVFPPEQTVGEAIDITANTHVIDMTNAADMTDQQWESIFQEVMSAGKIIVK